jgi:hypothetical protein
MREARLVKLGLPLVCAIALGVAVQYGCGSSGTDATGSGAGSGAGTGTAGGNSTGTNSGGGETGGGDVGGAGVGANGSGGLPAGSGGGGGADFTYDPPMGGNGGAGGSCVDETAAADPLPLDIYFMLDRSGSMGSDCNVTWPNAPSTSSRWCHAINAIAGYIQDPTSNGNRAAIESYVGSGCPSGLETPAAGLVDLTAQAGTLISAMDAIPYDPGRTPTSEALRGLVDFTTANQVAGRVIIGVLITDGIPNECSPTSDSGLATIVEDHFNNTGIHTFIVGITGASFSSLEAWADYPGAIAHDDTNDACGTCNGAGCTCHHYNVGDGDPTNFIAALQQIQNSVVGCTFAIPQPAQGVLDPDAVTVEYFPGGMPPSTVLPRVTDLAACAGNDGWYYDDNNNPSTIHLCPATCATVQADSMAQIDFRIDCQGS